MKLMKHLLVGLFIFPLLSTADPSEPHVFSYQFSVNSIPMGIAVDSNEDLWVSRTDVAHKIEKYNKDGDLLVSVGLPFAGTPLREYHFSQPRGIAVDSLDNVYVADFDPGRIQKYDSGGNFVLMWGWGVATGGDQFEICHENCYQRKYPSTSCPAGDVPFPVGLEVDDLDRVWVRENCDRVQVFDRNGNYLFSWPVGTGDTLSTGWLTLDSASNVYIPHSGFINKFDISGTLLTQWPHTIEGRGTAIEVDTLDYVYGVQGWNAGFWKYDDQGTFLVNFGREENFDFPSGLAFGANNVLYAVDRGRSLVKVFVPPYETFACDGFQPPMEVHPVKGKKNRSFPLKMQLFADGYEVTDTDISAAPLVEVVFTPTGSDEAIDVTGDLLSVGLGTDGNEFVYVAEDNMWKFNLKSTNYTGSGIYVVEAISADPAEYVLDPSCISSFEVK